MEIIPLPEAEIERWIDMRQALWPEESRPALASEVVEWASGKTGVFLAMAAGAPIGFAEVSMRERADGCSTSPVGYLEGWWVADEHRRQGVGAALVAAAEEWARRRGATEMGSDADADNEVSRTAHRALGFAEDGPVVTFSKTIGAGVSAELSAAAEVELREIDSDNVRAITRLEVAPHQRAFVAPNAVSLAQYAVTNKAWTRAIYADDEPVGYVLLSDDHERQRYYLWRFMIDRRYQGLGFGTKGMELVIDYVKGRPGASGLYLSYVPAQGGPEGFYKRLGFVDTGKVHGGEVEAFLSL